MDATPTRTAATNVAPGQVVSLPQGQVSREDILALMQKHDLVVHRQVDGTVILRARSNRAERRRRAKDAKRGVVRGAQRR